MKKEKANKTMFILEGKEYDAFELIYRLADIGVIHQLDHDNMEEEGVKVIL